MGDIVTIENDRWGISINSRIIEVMESEDENGYIVTPTFGA
ncbi:siphovirus ReqiPepy6 Gp37-like family protein [Erysipelatoclostridium ramosum]|nr:siphovirus ReqiPepy6 Gp37-like family protein [Thomasclavelia ramosa]MCB7430132.1 siphovirus ReqiPepy6 Gp37-like family protein [Thomasclavelia ramosa]